MPYVDKEDNDEQFPWKGSFREKATHTGSTKDASLGNCDEDSSKTRDAQSDDETKYKFKYGISLTCINEVFKCFK